MIITFFIIFEFITIIIGIGIYLNGGSKCQVLLFTSSASPYHDYFQDLALRVGDYFKSGFHVNIANCDSVDFIKCKAFGIKGVPSIYFGNLFHQENLYNYTRSSKDLATYVSHKCGLEMKNIKSSYPELSSYEQFLDKSLIQPCMIVVRTEPNRQIARSVLKNLDQVSQSLPVYSASFKIFPKLQGANQCTISSNGKLMLLMTNTSFSSQVQAICTESIQSLSNYIISILFEKTEIGRPPSCLDSLNEYEIVSLVHELKVAPISSIENFIEQNSQKIIRNHNLSFEQKEKLSAMIRIARTIHNYIISQEEKLKEQNNDL